MKKSKNSLKANKGITLIALVITIIVLLILAGVSIATLVGENGILTRASEASRETEIASVREQAQLDITNWVAGKMENGEDTTVNTPEKIQEILETENQNNGNKYYSGFSETGVTTPNGYEVPYEELYTTGTSGGETVSKTVEDLVAGDRVYYDTGDTSVGNQGVIECIVLYDSSSEYGVQIISADIVDTVTLGDSDFNTAKDSYNNALKILYNKAQEYLNTTYATSARCVGSKPDEPDWDTEEMLGEDDSDFFINMNKYSNIFKIGDENYDMDWRQMGTIAKVNIKDASSDYWMASRFFYDSSSKDFGVWKIVLSSGLTREFLLSVFTWGEENALGIKSNGFRPVLTLKSGIKVTEGDGETTPYTLAP